MKMIWVMRDGLVDVDTTVVVDNDNVVECQFRARARKLGAVCFCCDVVNVEDALEYLDNEIKERFDYKGE